jgi:hypothetical protein
MGIRDTGLLALALGTVLAPYTAGAAEKSFRLEAGPVPAARAASVDVRHVGWLRGADTASDPLHSETLTDADAGIPREKIKLRLRYQPVEGGPRFQIGTYGSRKGAMKRRLLHVAMDWAF